MNITQKVEMMELLHLVDDSMTVEDIVIAYDAHIEATKRSHNIVSDPSLTGKLKRQVVDREIRGARNAGTHFAKSNAEFNTSVRGKERRSSGSSRPSTVKGINYCGN